MSEIYGIYVESILVRALEFPEKAHPEDIKLWLDGFVMGLCLFDANTKNKPVHTKRIDVDSLSRDDRFNFWYYLVKPDVPLFDKIYKEGVYRFQGCDQCGDEHIYNYDHGRPLCRDCFDIEEAYNEDDDDLEETGEGRAVNLSERYRALFEETMYTKQI